MKSTGPGILAIGTANPRQRYSQRQVYDLLARHSDFYRSDRIEHIFMTSDIDFRHLYFDIDSLVPAETTDQLHERFRSGSLEIGVEAIQKCLASGGTSAEEIDFVVAVSCTGYLCPGLSSLVIKELGLKRNIQRADLLGMGCAGAMPGLQRAYDFVKAYPEKKALLLTVEICSACYYLDDSLETVVGNAICADGAAAVVVGMTDNNTHPTIRGFETLLEPSLINTVGFEQRDGKLRIILSKDIRDVAGALGKSLIGTLLASHRLQADDVQHWVLHSGGRKVIDSLRDEMNFTEAQLRHSRCVLKNYGNMSSPTVLFVLRETLEHSGARPGDLGVMLAMGPGLALEAALLEW